MTTTPRSVVITVALGLLLRDCGVLADGLHAEAAGQARDDGRQAATAPPPAPPVGAKAFATPQAAAAALIQAASAFDEPALIALVGPDGKDLVTTEDPVRDKSHALAFAALAKEGTRWS